MLKNAVQKYGAQYFTVSRPASSHAHASGTQNSGTSSQKTIIAAILFLAFCGLVAGFFVGNEPGSFIIIFAAIIGGYMALNIGANDVANNVGPAVGSGAMPLAVAIVLAFLFESAGALIAGGDVVKTIKKGIIAPSAVGETANFIWAMLSALIAAAVWVNIATYLRAPVSTTHSIVGGIVGAGIAAAGFAAVSWPTMGKIASSWFISPFLGGLIAASFLAFIKVTIIYRTDKIKAAQQWVPVLISLMFSVFACYLILKGLKKIWKPELEGLFLIGVAIFITGIFALRPYIARISRGLENRDHSLKGLFHLPLVIAAALLSFAHGANDVANAIGPLAAIIHALNTGDIAAKVAIPIWVMFIGALGLSVGLLLFGPRLIKVVGTTITRLNPIHAFCVALSSAITVIVASWLGLPVSSTHIAVGAVFGIGFFREYYLAYSPRRKSYLADRLRKSRQGAPTQTHGTQPAIKRKFVRRGHFSSIVAAWLITVPAAALLSASIYYMITSLG